MAIYLNHKQDRFWKTLVIAITTRSSVAISLKYVLVKGYTEGLFLLTSYVALDYELD